MAISTVANESLARLKLIVGNKYSSIALVADAQHSRVDVISSLVVFFGLFLIHIYPLLDSIIGIVLAFYIFYEAYQLGKESVDSLLDTANLELEEKIKVWLFDNHYQFSEIHTRKIGSTNMAQISLFGDPDIHLSEVTKLVKEVEKKLMKKFGDLKQVTIFVESHKVKENIIINNGEEIIAESRAKEL